MIDASHTFTVSLTPTDPNVSLTSADGRTAGAPPTTAVPEPDTLALLGISLGGLGFSHRRAKTNHGATT